MNLAPEVLPKLDGRVALITGASDGVGREIAVGLARAGARVLMPVRHRDKGGRAVDIIREAVPDADLELLDLDLSSLASVHALTAVLLEAGRSIDVAVLNAGVIMLGDKQRCVTDDGFELHFQTNFLGHAALALGLLPLLRGGRVVAQLSLAARSGRLNVADPQFERGYSAFRAYASSKLAFGAFALELARRSAGEDLGVGVQLCHPGVAPDTGIAAGVRAERENSPMAGFVRRLSNTPDAAAHPALVAAVTDAVSPQFFVPSGWGQVAGRAVSRKLYRRLRDDRHAEVVWQWAEGALAR